MIFNKLTFVGATISLSVFCSVSAMGDLFSIEVENKFVPILEYYDCATQSFPPSPINLISGKDLQNIGRKTSTAFIMGAQFYVVTNPTGKFEGLYAKFFNEIEPGLFLSRAHLEETIYIESNEFTPGNIIFNGYHLPIFSFQLCEDEAPTPHSACFKFGYLSNLKVFSDVINNVIKDKIAGITGSNNEPNVVENHSRILSDTPSRWQYQKIYTEWGDEDSHMNSYVETDTKELLPFHVMLGKLKINRFGVFSGTQELVFKKLSDKALETAETKKDDIESLMKAHNCEKF